MAATPVSRQHIGSRTGSEAGAQLTDQRLPGESARMTALLSGLAQTRDQAVFAELFKFYAPRLKSYIRRLGSDEMAAEEIVQEAMATVWNKAALFDAGKANASTWIFTIARNLRIDMIRRERRPTVDDGDLAELPDLGDLPDQVLSLSQRATAIRTAMQTLPTDQALIVRMSFFEEQPHSAIAEALNIPLGTVKSRLRLAFNRFRKVLGDLS
jgi:RNA polymerase sigma-70 factor (ECF subfamily)